MEREYTTLFDAMIQKNYYKVVKEIFGRTEFEQKYLADLISKYHRHCKREIINFLLDHFDGAHPICVTGLYHKRLVIYAQCHKWNKKDHKLYSIRCRHNIKLYAIIYKNMDTIQKI